MDMAGRFTINAFFLPVEKQLDLIRVFLHALIYMLIRTPGLLTIC